LAAHITERETATDCRWPPESAAIGVRDVGQLDGEALENLDGAPLHVLLLQHRGDGRLLLPAEEQVGDDVEVVAEGQVLVDGGDAELGDVARPRDHDRLAVEDDLPGVRVVDAGDDLDQRRFACSVVADQGDDLAGKDLEVDAVEGLHGPEALGDVLQLEDRGLLRDCQCLSPLRRVVESPPAGGPCRPPDDESS